MQPQQRNALCLSSILIRSVVTKPDAAYYSAEAAASLARSRKKNGFGTATKLGATNKIFVAATKNFAAATKRFVDRTKHFVVVTKCFCYPYFNK